MTLEEIKKMISGNELEEALENLEPFANEAGMEGLLSVISGEYRELENQQLLGTISFQDKMMQRNAISAKIIGLIANIDKKLAKENNVIKNNSNNNTVFQNIKNSTVAIGSNAESKKKKVLFIYSNPVNKNQLDFGAEIRRIKDALLTSPSPDRNKYEILVEEAVEDSKIFRLIRNIKPDFLHISLHASKKKGLLFQDKNGQEHPVSGEEMADFFELYLEGSSKIECAVFSACNSEGVAKAVQPFVKNAVGTRDLFPDDAAIIFASKFYEAIFDGIDVERAFKFAVLEIKYSGFEHEEDELPVHEIPVLFTNN